MRSYVLTLFICMFLGFSGFSQVPSPVSGTSGSANSTANSWTMLEDNKFYMYDSSGKKLTNLQPLSYLKTDTLPVLDKNTRTLYLCADIKEAPTGATGRVSVLANNVGKNFYITNPYSFIVYIDDASQSGSFSNVNGSYVEYFEEANATYVLDGIRNFSNWGAKSIYALPSAPNDTYWYRDTDKGLYAILIKGKHIDYTKATNEKDGNDLVVSIDGVKKYVLPGYYTMASFVYKPVQLYSASGSNSVAATNGSSGCVQGDCYNGWGKWQYENAHYDGFWKNGKKNGYGLYKWDGIGKYIGNWENDTMSGYGTYIADNDDNIVGEYRNGKLNGAGYAVYGKDWQQGLYTNGNLVTPYTFYTNNIEKGCTAGDCQNKYGKLDYANGDSYIGFFKNGNLYLGTYTFANGDKYSGMFNAQNQFHGTGRYFYASGGYYGGEWKNGQYNGRGYYHNSDFVQQVGEWSNGTFVKSLKK
ncbi:hypothetical protein [Altibacter sp.]|uniref:MORN repeat-containing protein n=1 Tax=Altibacter sp. TaxID=2024823 RepID=UPI0025BF2511|nr:hypothetical protein [Altibacter sp.]